MPSTTSEGGFYIAPDDDVERSRMSTYDDRLNGYETMTAPPNDVLVEVLCRDKVGTYILPFLCRKFQGGWVADSGRSLDVMVVGWRVPPAPASSR